MVGTGTDDARSRAFHEGGDECEGLIDSRWRVEDPGVGYDTDETGQNEDGESEWFRSRRQTSYPISIFGVIRDGVLDVRIYQDIHIGKQHLESPEPAPEPGLVILGIEHPRPVEVDSRAGVNTTHGDEPERRRLRCLATLQSVVQRPGYEGANADAAGFGCTAHLLRKLVVKGDRGPHDAQHNVSSSAHQTLSEQAFFPLSPMETRTQRSAVRDGPPHASGFPFSRERRLGLSRGP